MTTTKIDKDTGFLIFVILILIFVLILLKVHCDKQMSTVKNLGYNKGFNAAIQCLNKFPTTNNEAVGLSKCFNNGRYHND